jgi:cysteine desulfuration protein SufE
MTDPKIRDILEDFELLGDWDQRYRYLVEIGERLPPMDSSDKTEARRVKECMSIVHVLARADDSSPSRLHYVGDCDTSIVKGVVALLVRLFSGRTADEIRALDVDALFAGLHLEEHLSPNRHVGVYAIVEKMRAEANALAAA